MQVLMEGTTGTEGATTQEAVSSPPTHSHLHVLLACVQLLHLDICFHFVLEGRTQEKEEDMVSEW